MSAKRKSVRRKERTGPSLKAQNVRSHHVAAWYHEDERGIDVTAWRRGPRGALIWTNARIPWSRIMKSAARCGRWDAKQQVWIPSKRKVTR